MSIYLVMQASDGLERSFALRNPRTVIGREPACNVRIPIPGVSQKHCEITFDEAGAIQIKDLNTDHGTYHNGQRVQQATLAHEDKVTIGPVTFVVRVQQPSPAQFAHGETSDGPPPAHIVIERLPDGEQ